MGITPEKFVSLVDTEIEKYMPLDRFHHGMGLQSWMKAGYHDPGGKVQEAQEKACGELLPDRGQVPMLLSCLNRIQYGLKYEIELKRDFSPKQFLAALRDALREDPPGVIDYFVHSPSIISNHLIKSRFDLKKGTVSYFKFDKRVYKDQVDAVYRHGLQPEVPDIRDISGMPIEEGIEILFSDIDCYPLRQK